MPLLKADKSGSKLFGLTVLVVAICTCLAMVPGTAVAQDEWPDDCDTAEPVESGTYSGSLTPNDEDNFKLNIPEGDYITGNLSFQPATTQGELSMDVGPDAAMTAVDGSEIESLESVDKSEVVDTANYRLIHMFSGNVQFRIYSESSEPVCVQLHTLGDIPGDWMFSFTSTGETPSHDASSPEQTNDSSNESTLIATAEQESRLEIHSTADNDEFAYRFLIDGTAEKTQVGESGIAADADDTVTEYDNGTVLVMGTTGDGAGDAYVFRGDIISSQVSGSDEVIVYEITDITDRFVNNSAA